MHDDGPVPPRIPRLLAEPIAFAHRGASAHERENTLAAFELALRLGASGLESDVWRTADGEAALVHDGLVGRLGRRRRIAALERRRLPGHIPTIDELFESVGTDFHLSLDIKDPAAIEAVVDAVGRADGDADGLARRVWICHPDLAVLTGWRDRWPHLRYVNSVRLPKLDDSPEQRAAALAGAGIDAMNMHYSDWTGGLTTLFHRFGVLAFGWDAQHERVAAELVDAGCDAIYGDHVDRLLAATARDGAKPAVNGGSEPSDVVEGPDS